MYRAGEHPDALKAASAQDVDNLPLKYKKFKFMVPMIEYRSVVVNATTMAEAERKAKKLAMKRHKTVITDQPMKLDTLYAAANAKDMKGYGYSHIFNNWDYSGKYMPRTQAQIVDNINIVLPIESKPIKDIP